MVNRGVIVLKRVDLVFLEGQRWGHQAGSLGVGRPN